MSTHQITLEVLDPDQHTGEDTAPHDPPPKELP